MYKRGGSNGLPEVRGTQRRNEILSGTARTERYLQKPRSSARTEAWYSLVDLCQLVASAHQIRLLDRVLAVYDAV